MPQPRHHNAFAGRLLTEAMAHHQAGRLAEAEQAYNEVLKADKRNVDALRLLGTLYVHTARYARAIELLQQASALQPGNADILNNLGVALRNEGRTEDAAKRFGLALGIKPDYAAALRNHAGVLRDLGRLDEAVARYRLAVQAQPDDIVTLCALGNLLRDQGKAADAIASYEEALRARPNVPELFVNLGAAHWDLGRLDKAIECYREALRLRPGYADALVNYGIALWGDGRPEEAEAKCNEALRTQPGNAEALTCLGALMHDQNRFDDALAFYEKALQAKPGCPDASWRKSLILLRAGNYAEGWKLYETGLGVRSLRGLQRFPARPWDGSPAPGKRLLIWSEQGLGDSLQFIRYAALCRQRVGKVIVLCAKPLIRLFKDVPFIDDAVENIRDGAFDFHVAMMSLPHLFGTTLETVPAQIPYLQAPPDAARKWANAFADLPGIKAGLVWAGNAREGQINANLTDKRRSISLERLMPLFAVPDISFINLQMGEARKQIGAFGLADRIADKMDAAGDFADTAAIIRNLDLVITVDTSVAHLAGALGKPVWILSRYDACWRWLGNRPGSPWYPTARIFGQPMPGDWESVVAQLRDALAAFKLSG